LRPSSYKHVNFPNIYYRMFLSNWLLITKIVAASVVEEIDYPSPEDFFLAFDGTNTLFSYGGSKVSASNVAIYYDEYQHEMGNAYPVTLSEPGEYKARVDICGEKYLTEAVTVSGVSPVLSTLAFHHGTFDDVYGDGDVAAAATNGHVYANTPLGTYSWGTLTANTTTSSNTMYEWTPSATMVADVLMVAGGGGGGGSWGGGGGAGGLLFNTGVTMSGQKTIVVGNGGAGGYGNLSGNELGLNGSNTFVTGFTQVIGGGGGGSNNTGRDGSAGGSGGGGSRDSDGLGGSGISGPPRQGYDGGDGDTTATNYAGGGGGGAGGDGGDGNGGTGGGSGGLGYSAISVFGMTYGDSGYFASGGGGGVEDGYSISGGVSPNGGGGNGTSTSVAAGDGAVHTGGGGGGAGFNGNSTSQLGGSGGSGIVLLSYQYSTTQLTYNDYNKLTVANTGDTNLRLGANTWDIATASNVWICKPGDYKSFTVDHDGEAAYFGNVTVAAVTEEPDPYASETKFIGANGFGFSVDISGNKGIIGNRDGNYVYFIENDGSEWTYNEVTGASRFGWKVGISGNYAAVASSSIGKITIYKHDGTSWSEIHSVTDSTNYGDGLAIDGTNIITGQRYNGRVRILSRVSDTSWTIHTLTLSSYTTSNRGHILDISGDYAIIGLPDNDSSKGAVAIFYWSGSSWAQQGSFIKPSVETANDVFGSSVSISENYAVIGAPGNTSSTGCVYIFTRNGTSWGSEVKIVANDASTGDKFGYSVKLSGDYIIVGAREADPGSVSNTGAVYIFKRDGTSWSQIKKLVASNGVANEYFGESVSISGDNAIVGAYGGSFGYVYDKDYIQPSLTTATPGTLAFHHGTFDDVYGDGDVATAAANGHVYADTPTGAYAWGTLVSRTQNGSSSTTYEWTPPSGFVASDVLMVAGGGSGGSDRSGGGGAGGLVFSQNESISGQQTIIVGAGGGVMNAEGVGNNGQSTVAFGYTSVGGGGGGATSSSNGSLPGNNGGSGGGGGGMGPSSGGSSTQNSYSGKGFGNAGGNGVGTSEGSYTGAGGGGAGTSGENSSGGDGGDGGDGKDYTATFGATYGDAGWFAGGGGGGYDVSGGSGIVLISYPISTTPSLTYDGYNKLTVARVRRPNPLQGFKRLRLGTASNVYIADPGEYTYFTRDAATAFLANVTVGSVTEDTTRVVLKTTDTVFSTASYSHGSVAMSADATLIAWQPTTYNNGKMQVYKGTPETGYLAYGSEFTPFNGNEFMLFDMSGDGKYLIVTTYNGGNDGYKMYKNNGTSFVYDSAYSFIGAFTDSGQKPSFVPSNNNFAIIGVQAVSNTTWYIKLYEYDSGSETWTGKTTLTGPSLANSDHNLAHFGCSFSYDGQYLLLTQDSSNDRLYILNVDWDNNSVTPVHTYSPTTSVTTAAALSPDNKYFVNFNHLGVYEVWENTSGDWSSVSNVTADFNLGEKFGSYGVCWSGYDADNLTPLYIAQQGSLYGDDLIRIEQWSRAPASPPSLAYDGITNLKITGAESSSYITYKNATSDKLLACGTDLTTYPLYTAGGNYKAEISGPTTFTFTSNVTVPEGELLPLYKYPPEGGTTSSLTHGTAADADADWTISGADYGNGEYFARANVVTVSNQSAYHAFDSNLTAGSRTPRSPPGPSGSTCPPRRPSTSTWCGPRRPMGTVPSHGPSRGRRTAPAGPPSTR
jgi:hypothetical protein